MDADLAAGDFSAWLAEMRAALRDEQGTDVPCDGCTACCTSSQFVHIEPDEADTLAHIPADLLFAAPLMPPGHLVLGYDERGHCPMLVDGKCSIYEHRPRTCRTYDCRIFAAAGVEVDDDESPAIAERARRWRFAFPTPADETRHAALDAATAFLRRQTDLVPPDPTRLAVLAVELHHFFLDEDEATGSFSVIEPDPDAVRAVLSRG